MRPLRLLACGFMLVLSGPLLAAQYWWSGTYLTPQGTFSKEGSSPLAVCQAIIAATGVRFHSLVVNGRTAYCYQFRPTGTDKFLASQLWRGGDSCPAGTEYDAENGECYKPTEDCASTVGALFPARGPTAPVIESGGRFYIGGPPASEITACYQSCRYGEGGRASSCYRLPGSTTEGFCNYILKGLGESCSADSYQFATSGDPLNPGTDPGDPSVPPSDPNDPGCPSGWMWSGTTCVKDPGAGNGEGNGSGEGSGGGESSGGGGGGSDEEGDEPSDNSVQGEDCDAELSCSGDAIQCAVLRQQKELRCQIEVLNDFDKHQDDIAKTIEGEDFELTKDEEINVAGFLSEGTGRRFLPSACPADKTFSLRTGGGRTFAFTYAPLCQLATDLSYLIVIAATIFFAVYVGRSFGGE